MCGIVGYVGARPVRELLLAGLEKLEYRGYDSAGISVARRRRVESVRAVGNLAALRRRDRRAPSRRRRRRRHRAPPTPRAPASATRAGPRTAA